MRMTVILAGWFLLTAAASGAAAEEVAFDDSVWLSHDAAKLAVSLKVGRIVHFGRTGGANLLWVSPTQDAAAAQAKGEWVNWGGDKVWPAFQGMWPQFVPNGKNWPPDGVIDGQPWTLGDRGERHVSLQSAVNPHLQARVSRRIELDAAAAQVRMINALERVASSPLPVMVWSVTQVRHPRYVLMEVAVDRPASEADRPWHRMGGETDWLAGQVQPVGDGAIRVATSGEQSMKVGTLGRWIAGVWDDAILLQIGSYDPAASYPDRSSVQVYCDGNYAELELLGPQAHPKAGERIEQPVTWRLLDKSADMDEMAVLKLIEAALQ